jgi:endonuclease III-like uncharacterized protein
MKPKLKDIATGIILIQETEWKKIFKIFFFLLEEVVSNTCSLKHLEIFSS